MAEESVVTDLPMKRPREDEENGASAATEAMETEANSSVCISSVIPGWFSEISPMWPGISLLQYPFIFLPPFLLLAARNTKRFKTFVFPCFFGIQDDMLMLFCVAVDLTGDYVFMLLSE